MLWAGRATAYCSERALGHTMILMPSVEFGETLMVITPSGS
jgi:hypothetical protein